MFCCYELIAVGNFRGVWVCPHAGDEKKMLIKSLLILLTLVASCSLLPQQQPLAPVARGVDPATLAAQRRHRLRLMLANAQQALADDRLMLPVSGSAYSWYQQVLAQDELNAEAHWGMQQITLRYLQLAEQAFQSRRIDKAEQMLQRAEFIAASPAQTNAIRERYPQTVTDNEILLATRDLSARGGAIQSQLKMLAQQAKAGQSRLLIIARSDNEGRWIYQQMRSAVEGYRLRGNIEIGVVPRIVLLDL